jgi:hypothetical protein
VDLHVPVHRRLADTAGRPALGIEAVGQVGDRLLQALRDGHEVLLVVGDQRRVGLGGETVGKVERTGSQEIHVISSDLTSLATAAGRRRPGAHHIPSAGRMARADQRPRATRTPTAIHAFRDPVSVNLSPASDYAA